jgi:hypothetical protein
MTPADAFADFRVTVLAGLAKRRQDDEVDPLGGPLKAFYERWLDNLTALSAGATTVPYRICENKKCGGPIPHHKKAGTRFCSKRCGRQVWSATNRDRK